MVYKKVLGIVPGLMAVSLAVKTIPKNMLKSKLYGMKQKMPYKVKPIPKYLYKNHKKQVSTLIKGGAGLIVGATLIGATASVINDL